MKDLNIGYYYLRYKGKSKMAIKDVVAGNAKVSDIARNLIYARIYARKGDIQGVQTFSNAATIYAEILGQDVSERVENLVGKILRLGYQNALTIEIDYAENYAKTFNSLERDICLESAQKYAKILGQDISAKVAEIRALMPKPSIN